MIRATIGSCERIVSFSFSSAVALTFSSFGVVDPTHDEVVVGVVSVVGVVVVVAVFVAVALSCSIVWYSTCIYIYIYAYIYIYIYYRCITTHTHTHTHTHIYIYIYVYINTLMIELHSLEWKIHYDALHITAQDEQIKQLVR